MKHLLLLMLALALVGCQQSSPPSPPSPAATIAELRGQWVVINYWAQWCGPCIREIPELNRLHHELAQVAVLGVNYDGAIGAELAGQVAELGVEFPNLLQDPATELGAPRPLVLPTTFIVSPAGELVLTLQGPQTFDSLRAATSGKTQWEPPAT